MKKPGGACTGQEPSESPKNEIKSMHQNLHSPIDKWCTTQKSLMEKIGDHVTSQTLESQSRTFKF